ncbi:hypothetical protein PS726_00154 [Pseudomonas fluorescens]|nr:hypothetical protein PS726_00154 [Pseudomonas fluorescens]
MSGVFDFRQLLRHRGAMSVLNCMHSYLRGLPNIRLDWLVLEKSASVISGYAVRTLEVPSLTANQPLDPSNT